MRCRIRNFGITERFFQPCCDYVIDVKSAGRQQQFSVGDTASIEDAVVDYEMPYGTSLTFTGYEGNSVVSNAIWLIRQRTFTGDVRAAGNRITFKAMGHSSAKQSETKGDVHVLKGKLFVDNAKSNDEGLKFQAGYSHTVKIESEISGSGTISLQVLQEEGSNASTYELAGTNSFTGKWFVYSKPGAQLYLTLRFSDASNFGPGGYTHDDIVFQAGNLLIHPTRSVVLNIPQRKISFYSGNIDIRINEGDELKISSPVSFRNGSKNSPTVLRKTGRGILALAGNTEIVTNNDMPLVWALNVDEGHIRADNARAFSGMTVTFADGAGIAAKYNPGSDLESAQYGMIVTNAAMFTVSGAKLPVKIDTNGDAFFNKSLPVLTVPAGSADDFGAKLKGITDIPMGSVSFVRKNVKFGEEDFVCFSAEVHRGTVITLR